MSKESFGRSLSHQSLRNPMDPGDLKPLLLCQEAPWSLHQRLLRGSALPCLGLRPRRRLPLCPARPGAEGDAGPVTAGMRYGCRVPCSPIPFYVNTKVRGCTSCRA